MVTLTISHNIFLSKQQRYSWYSGEEFEVIGTSTPVWFNQGKTSEPGQEVFTKYKLEMSDDHAFIKNTRNGYILTAAPEPIKPNYTLTDDQWNKLSPEERQQWVLENEGKVYIKNLLDIKDGGSAWMAFRQLNKIRRNKKYLNVIHFVEVKTIEDLMQSLC